MPAVCCVQVGEHWAFCDAETEEAELPDCVCQGSWTVEDEICKSLDGAAEVAFEGCPSEKAWASRCANKRNGMGQPWCKTTQQRCKQQSGSNDKYIENMVNTGWSYCTPAAGTEQPKAVEPTCQCKPHWNNTEGPRCAREEGNEPILMHGCPELGDIRRCEYEVRAPFAHWCAAWRGSPLLVSGLLARCGWLAAPRAARLRVDSWDSVLAAG